MVYVISPSTQLNKKYQVKIFRHVMRDGKRQLVPITTIHFGSSLHNDFTTFPRNTPEEILHAETRRKLYIKRHKKNENWNDIFTAGFWSHWILWHLPTIKESVAWLKREKKMDVYFKE